MKTATSPEGMSAQYDALREAGARRSADQWRKQQEELNTTGEPERTETPDEREAIARRMEELDEEQKRFLEADGTMQAALKRVGIVK